MRKRVRELRMEVKGKVVNVGSLPVYSLST